MPTRDLKLPLVLISLCLGAGVYFSLRHLTPPASAATSQDQQATNQNPDLAFDRRGNLYITDNYNSVIRKVYIGSGVITTVAGRNAPGNIGFGGDGGPATQALIFSPIDVAFDSAGNLFIADSGN